MKDSPASTCAHVFNLQVIHFSLNPHNQNLQYQHLWEYADHDYFSPRSMQYQCIKRLFRLNPQNGCFGLISKNEFAFPSPFTWDWQIRKTAPYNLRCHLQFYTSINVQPSKRILTLQSWNREKHRQLWSKDNSYCTSLKNSIRNFNRRKLSLGNSLCRMYHTTLSFSAGSGIAKHKKSKNW